MQNRGSAFRIQLFACASRLALAAIAAGFTFLTADLAAAAGLGHEHLLSAYGFSRGKVASDRWGVQRGRWQGHAIFFDFLFAQPIST
jgi:hypothetical protein